MQTGLVYFEDRDIATDFALALTGFSGWPGMLGGAPRDVPLLDGLEMQGAILDSRLIRRRPTHGRIGAVLITDSVSEALTKLDALKALLGSGEIAVRAVYAPTRECLAVCDAFEVLPYTGTAVDGQYSVEIGFTIKAGVAQETAPELYALTSSPIETPLGTAESKPVIVIHGNGSPMTNPVITIKNIAGDVVQTMGFTVSLGATDQLRIDAARYQVSRTVGLVTTDALAEGTWTSGDFPVLRPWDGLVELSQYPTIELSSTSGTPVGTITYTKRWL